MVFTKGHTYWQHPNSVKTRFRKGTSVRVGMKHTEATKVQVSENRKGKALGAKNPSWKGGITPMLIKIKRLTEYKEWQKGVFKRDDYRCRACHRRGSLQLTPHHLVSFSFLVQMLKVRSVEQAREEIGLWNVRNGVTLCDACHKETSNYGWRASKTPRDRALYPVLCLLLAFGLLFPAYSEAATFGYTSIGASAFGGANTMHSGIFTGADGTLDSITAYLGNGSGGRAAKLGVYRDSDAALIFGGATAFDPATDWYTESSGTGQTLSAVSYRLTAWFSAGIMGTSANIYGDSSGGTGGSVTSTYGATWPDPQPSLTGNSRRYSIYATYTAGGGGGDPVPVQSIIFFD